MNGTTYWCSFPSRYEHDHTDPEWCPACEDYGFLDCAYRGRHRWQGTDRCLRCGQFRTRRAARAHYAKKAASA